MQVRRRVLDTVNFRADGIQHNRDLQVYVPQGVCGVYGDRLGERSNVDLGGEHAVNAVGRYRYTMVGTRTATSNRAVVLSCETHDVVENMTPS